MHGRRALATSLLLVLLGTPAVGDEPAEAPAGEAEAARAEAARRRVLALLGLLGTEQPAQVARAEELLAREDDAHKEAPLLVALGCEPASLRRYAAGELARLGARTAVPALVHRALLDRDAGVREAVVDALARLDEPGTVHRLGRALWSLRSDVRVRAAHALARLGGEVGAAYVLVRWEKRAGEFPRVYLAQTSQSSYVQDFDVEVASTSFIADPIMGTLQEGVVHDVKIQSAEQVLTSTERVAYRDALVRLLGVDRGRRPEAWRRWWDDRERTRAAAAHHRGPRTVDSATHSDPMQPPATSGTAPHTGTPSDPRAP